MIGHILYSYLSEDTQEKASETNYLETGNKYNEVYGIDRKREYLAFKN